MTNVQHERFCTFSRRYSSPRRKWPSSSDDPHLEEKNFTIDRPWFSGPVKGKRPGLEHFSHGAASSRHVGSITKMLEVSEKPNVFPLHFNAVRMRRLNYFLHFFQSQKMNEWWEFSPFRGRTFRFVCRSSWKSRDVLSCADSMPIVKWIRSARWFPL